MRDWISGWSTLMSPLHALGIASRRIREERVRVGTGRPLHGGPITILHLSDLHFGPRDRAKLKALEEFWERPFDLVCVTGDFVDDDSDEALDLCARALAGFRPRWGTFGVPGNHEYYLYRISHTIEGCCRSHERKRTERIFERLAAAGVRWLVNERVDLDGIGVRLMGVGDRHYGNDELSAVLDRSPANGRVRILLCHNPATAAEAAGRGVDLAVCGHTHGGQIRLPGIGAIRRGAPIARSRVTGLWREGETIVYVSRGLGEHSHLPVRLFCPPEAATVVVAGATDGPG